MSLETRSSSALFKRAEQLRRWEESETNREPVTVNCKPKKIKFSAGCVFLAACKAGDRDEILRLLKKGADIDTHDVDGLSALHQACIDDNLELVEFLVENGADVNKGDNEGWTPLHATASCGFLSIARYLIEKGANVAAVNNDGELPVDVAESDEMEDMLQQQLEDLGIDAENARTEEERLMLADAKNWLSSGYFGEKPHPKTGATALHVAAAKGYLKVMDILIKAGANVNAQDYDGWTPLHAAAHWGQKEAAEVLTEAHCDMGIRNCVGQTAFDVAENEMVRVLEDLRKKQATLPKDNERRKNINAISMNTKPVISDGLESKSDRSSDKEDENENSSPDKVPPVQKVELQIHSPTKQLTTQSVATSNPNENQSNVDTDDDDDEVDSLSTETSDTGKSTDVSDDEDTETGAEEDIKECQNVYKKKNRVNKDELSRLPSMAEANKTVPNNQVQTPPTKQNELEDSPSWRRPGSFRSRLQESTRPGLSLKIGDKESPTGAPPGMTLSSVRQQNAVRSETPQEVVLRRTQSFEADEKFYRRYLELRAKINAGNSCPTLHSTPMRSASLKERRVQAREESLRLSGTPSTTTITSPATTSPPVSVAAIPSTVTVTTPTSPQGTVQVRSVTPSTPTTPGGSKLSPANIFKNFFKSFVPPVRDEESETQRKAHAKRVRETRRSTQGVTLEEIKSAEQLVKKKQQQVLQQAQQLNNTEPTDEVVVKVHKEPPSSSEKQSSEEGGGSSPPVVSATLTRGNNTPTFNEERRPSWRLRVDNGSKFMLEDARKSDNSTTSSSTTTTNDVVRKTAVAIPVTETGDTTVTLPLRKSRPDEKEEKESESRNAQATQAAIQRRRRPKRRSTGVVHVDMDEIDPERNSDTSGGTSPSGDGYNPSLSASSPYLNSSYYGGTSSGYGGIYVPSSSSLHTLSVPSIPGLSSYSSPLSRSPTASQLPSRSGSFNRQRSRSRVRAVAAAGGSTKSLASEGYHSGGEASEPPSRLNSVPPPEDRSPVVEKKSTENGEIDYKKLYEESLVENERLRDKLRQTEEELAATKVTSEKNALLASRNSLSETEKRERRAMERKLSEMEEELKQLQKLKSDNERLRAENRALTRVVSKLTSSHIK